MFLGYQTHIKIHTFFHMADVFGLLDHEDESTMMLQNFGIYFPSCLSLPSRRSKPNIREPQSLTLGRLFNCRAFRNLQVALFYWVNVCRAHLRLSLSVRLHGSSPFVGPLKRLVVFQIFSPTCCMCKFLLCSACIVSLLYVWIGSQSLILSCAQKS
jgi:hypothetical protein